MQSGEQVVVWLGAGVENDLARQGQRGTSDAEDEGTASTDAGRIIWRQSQTAVFLLHGSPWCPAGGQPGRWDQPG
jgi:hypothetical protein